MTIDEAIKHCEEVAEKYDTELNLINCGISNESCDDCLQCAEEHRQLAEWLKKLKAYRNAITEMKKWINSNNRGNADYFIVDKIEGIIEEVNADDESNKSGF